MRRFGFVCVIGLATLSLVACGPSKEEKAAAEAQKQAAEAQKAAAEAQTQAAAAMAQGAAGAQAGAEGFAQGMAQFGKAMQGLQQSPDGKAYTPVSFKDLHALLPDLPGWEKGTPKGEMMTAPVTFSQSEVTYTKGDAQIEVKIVDTAMSSLLTMPYRMFMATGYTKETDTGYEKATVVGGNPGWEKWDNSAKHAELGTVVGNRFLITIDGNDIADVKPVKDIASRIDMAKLAALK